MPLLDDIQRVWRRFQRYTGDGLPNQPVGHPLSSGGDPRSGIYNPDKTEIRDLLVSIAQSLGDPSALASILTQLDGKAGLANAGKSFRSRADAVNFGQANLPASLGVIVTLEGDYQVIREPGSSLGQDSLFETSPYWSVQLRVPNDAALEAEADARKAVINASDGAFRINDPVGYVLMRADADEVRHMGRVIARAPVDGRTAIPTPAGDVAALIGNGELDLDTSDGLLLRDELGFVLLRVNTAGMWFMGAPIGATSPVDIQAGALDAIRNVWGIDRRALRPFRKWVAARAGPISGLGRARILHVGDSNTMGHSAMGNGQHRRAQSYPTHLATLAADRSPSWGNFFGRAISETSITNLQAYDPRMVVGAGWTAGGPASIGGEMWINSTTTAPLSLTPVEAWDTAEVYISVDEAVTVEIGIAGALVSHTPAVGQVVKLTYSAATAAQQALQIVRQSGAVRVIGAHCYKSGAGVDILNAGRSGWRSDQYAAVASYYSPLAALPALGADLWVIQLGLNDFDQGRNPASFGADLRAIANAGLAAGASVVLVVSLNPGSIDVYPWADYRGQIYTVAAELGCALVDVGILYGPHAEALADGLVTNDLHPSARGYAETARAIHQLIF